MANFIASFVSYPQSSNVLVNLLIELVSSNPAKAISKFFAVRVPLFKLLINALIFLLSAPNPKSYLFKFSSFI
jgi:hypothetical protein